MRPNLGLDAARLVKCLVRWFCDMTTYFVVFLAAVTRLELGIPRLPVGHPAAVKKL
jgi:hypothetical protein